MGLAYILRKLLIGNLLSTNRGRIVLFGRMDWTLIPSKALAMNIQAIGERCGEEFLYRLGYEGAKQAAKDLLQCIRVKPKGGWETQKVVISLLDFLGYGKPEFIITRTRRSGRHYIVFKVKDNPVIEHAARLYGKRSKVCSWFMGIYAAHGEMELGLRHVRLKETECLCKGAACCVWESKW